MQTMQIGKKSFIQLFIIFWLIIFSCREPQIKRLTSSPAKTGNVVKDIPSWYNQSSFLKKMGEQLRESLKLESLQNGFDSLQIRIWIECGYESSSLILLENVRSKWNAVFYWFKISPDEKMNIKIKNLHVENRSPKSGWEFFSETLIKTGIIDLLDESELPSRNEFLEPTDADDVTVEIGTPHRYRWYEYIELGFNSISKEALGNCIRPSS